MVHRSWFHDSWNSWNFVDMRSRMQSLELPSFELMDQAWIARCHLSLSSSIPLLSIASRAQSFKGIKEGRWRRRRAAQRACESKRAGKFRREYIKQLLVSSFSRGGHRRDRTERRGFHLRYETASGSPLLLSPSPLQVTLGNGFRFLSLNA